jgi:hypothetical protein
MQKINKLKIALRAEIDAIKAGVALEGPVDATSKKTATPRKRKGAAAEDDGDGTPKKRGRAKKIAAPEVVIKDEVKGEQDEDVKDEV